MAHWTCGFEGGDLQYYRDLGWVFDTDVRTAISSTAGDFHQSLAGRGGSFGLVVGDVATSPSFGVGGYWVHFWLQGAEITTGIELHRAGGAQFSVSLLSSGVILLRRGNSFTGVVLDVGGYTPSVDHWIAIEAKLLNVGGQVTVFVDGVQAAQTTGNTQSNGTFDGFDQIRLEPSNNTDRAYDDFIVTTEIEGRLGEHFLTHMTLSGNDVIGSGAGSTGGAGTYLNADEIPPDEGTSYNEFTATGTDRYLTTNLGYVPVSIHCVGVSGQAARDGTITQGQTIVATDPGGGAVEALGTIDGLGAAGVYAAWQDCFGTDPGSSSAIVAVSSGGPETFSIAGDVTTTIRDGSTVEVTGSTGNDGSYAVISTAFSSPNTVITVAAVPNATADGNLTYNWVGATLDDLRVGVKFS